MTSAFGSAAATTETAHAAMSPSVAGKSQGSWTVNNSSHVHEHHEHHEHYEPARPRTRDQAEMTGFTRTRMSDSQAGMRAARGPSREPPRVLGNQAGAFAQTGLFEQTRRLQEPLEWWCLWSPKFGRR